MNKKAEPIKALLSDCRKIKNGENKLKNEKQNFARKAGPAQPRWWGQGVKPLVAIRRWRNPLMPLGAPQGVNLRRRRKEGEALR